MTKAQAALQFARFYLSQDDFDSASDGEAFAAVSKAKDDDEIMVSEDWNNYTDSLCKDGEITQHQYNTWVTPKF